MNSADAPKSREPVPDLGHGGLRHLLDSVPGVVFQYEIGTEGNDRFAYVSPAARAIWGVSPEQLYADATIVWRLIHPEDVDRLRREVREQVLDAEPRCSFEYRIVKPDGAVRWIQCNAIKGPTSSGALMLHAVAVDQTDHHRAEEAALTTLARNVDDRTAELKAANEALARAAKLKDEFLASMSHELRTPLTSILGLTEALSEGVYGELQAMQLRSLKTITSSARHLLELINDILDLSKVEAGMLELHLEPVSVSAICESAMLFVKPTAFKKKLRLNFTADPQATSVPADSRRLKQILVNLLSNAVKFTPDSGSVGLEVTVDPAKGTILFSVWDTGIGISPEDQSRLFQPFVQLYAGLAKQYVGTGLGLSLVKKMTELHKGRVTIESQPGSGSRFNVELPWEPAPAIKSDSKTAIQTPMPKNEGLGLRVLVAEDAEPVIRMVCDYLRARGYEVTVARNGHLALELAFEARPDIILMDVHMPGMNGLEAIKMLRNHPITAAVPIIAVTAQAMAGDREKMLQSGATDYLSKPFTLRALAGKIAQMVQPKPPTENPE